MKELVPIALFSLIAAVIIVVSILRHRERLEMISRGMQPVAVPKRTGNGSLFWGLLAVGIGLALVIGYAISGSYADKDTLTAAPIFLLGGVALLAYWKISRNISTSQLLHGTVPRHEEVKQNVVDDSVDADSGSSENDEIK